MHEINMVTSHTQYRRYETYERAAVHVFLDKMVDRQRSANIVNAGSPMLHRSYHRCDIRGLCRGLTSIDMSDMPRDASIYSQSISEDHALS